MSDILSREDFGRRVMASIFGTPSEGVEPLMQHDAALRAQRDEALAMVARLAPFAKKGLALSANWYVPELEAQLALDWLARHKLVEAYHERQRAASPLYSEREDRAIAALVAAWDAAEAALALPVEALPPTLDEVVEWIVELANPSNWPGIGYDAATTRAVCRQRIRAALRKPIEEDVAP